MRAERTTADGSNFRIGRHYWCGKRVEYSDGTPRCLCGWTRLNPDRDLLFQPAHSIASQAAPDFNASSDEKATARDLERLLLVLDDFMAKSHEYMQLPIDCLTRALGFGLAHELAHAFLGTNSALEPNETLADCFGLILANLVEPTVDLPLQKVINGNMLQWNVTGWEAENAVRKRESALIGLASRLKQSSASYRGRPFGEWMQFCTPP